jgi:hypothetical protein
MDDSPLLPKHLAWFAPWCWSRRTFALVAIPVLLLIYGELLPVFWFTCGKQLSPTTIRTWSAVMNPLLLPHRVASDRCQAVNLFYETQAHELSEWIDQTRRQW